MQFVVDRSKSDVRTADGAVASVHAGEFGGACEEWEGAPMTGLPGSMVLVGRCSVLTRLSSGFGAALQRRCREFGEGPSTAFAGVHDRGVQSCGLLSSRPAPWRAA